MRLFTKLRGDFVSNLHNDARSPSTGSSREARGGGAKSGIRQLGIEDIRSAVANGRVRVTDHAEEGARSDRLTLDQVFASLLRAEVVENYPTEWPYASWLVRGKTAEERPIHSVWACNSKNGWAVLIQCTVAAPNEQRNHG